MWNLIRKSRPIYILRQTIAIYGFLTPIRISFMYNTIHHVIPLPNELAFSLLC